MENYWKQYQIKTLNIKARTILTKAIKEFKNFTGQAIDIGCGSGNDTVYLIKKGWKVLAIDKEPWGFENIKRKINNKISRLETLCSSFENLSELPSTDLVVANYSLAFCLPTKFNKLWKIIKKSINKKGMFVGNFFGKNDTWAANKRMCFIDKKDLENLFEDFNILYLKEIEKDEKTALEELKHWHIFEIIAIKK